jgi:ribosomal protein S27AE
LKYYNVDADGKITRLRRECPGEQCGAGVFMAMHFNRQTCGKCGLTYMFAAKDIKAPKAKVVAAAVVVDAKAAGGGKKKGKK